MYDGFQRDLRRAVEGGDEAVRQFIHDTAKARGVDPFEVFAETARQRIAWDREPQGAAEPAERRRGRRTRRPSVRTVARGLLGGLWRRRRARRRGLVAQASRAALGAAGKAVRRASKRLARATWRAARRTAQRAARDARKWAGKAAGRWGEYAYSIGYRIVNKRWPTRTELRRGNPQQPQRRPIPQPSPAVQALLDGYSFREATYLFGERDPTIRDPADDWPGALKDFHQAVRNYYRELTRYIEEVS